MNQRPNADCDAGLVHRTTDPVCIEHVPPRTWWQRRRFNRGRALACMICRFGTRVTSPDVGATDEGTGEGTTRH